MRRKVASIVLAGVGCISSFNAWSWTKDGDNIHFNSVEWDFCEKGAMDAAAVMLSRQSGNPLSYPDDERTPPSDTQIKVREKFILLAGTFPIETTEEKKMAAVDKFSKEMRSGCLRYLKIVMPEEAKN
ncbi:hypothetical protein [Pseudomonas quasicaspiana]|uniref:hypothetical protein n=1 Tax=Pseudomonas quasicaspiana TaxID=2829821 RepID=UPI001E42CF3C|nr:hypothetical protein [Pseudomonas quasicaspiana]MCD5970799.1 hypothetical protein [Pseudomonas quasicaspiana]